MGFKNVKITAKNIWFTGAAGISTYEVEEILGTKLRALYQRKKGRDLYDMITAVKHFKNLDPKQVVKCFRHYLSHQKTTVTRAQFEINLAEKLMNKAFTQDIVPLLSASALPFDAQAAAEILKTTFLALLPGESWRGYHEI
jgi:predicted nucleotidyltransferase component of viral defense system